MHTQTLEYGIYQKTCIYFKPCPKENIVYKFLFRANPGLEFVVAKTLAKWKKLGPNELYFSQGFSQKVVSKSCTVFLIWPISKE